MVGAPFTDEEVLGIKNMDDTIVMVGPPTTIAPPSIAPLEPSTVVDLTLAVNDDSIAHRPPTTRRVLIDERAVGLPQPSTTVRPPAWVCCAHGEHHDVLTQAYSWLIGHCNCDEASIMSFFALLQYNPTAYVACMEILEEIATIEEQKDIRNYSAKLARLVENARKRVYPDGIEHAGKHSVDVDADVW